MTGRPGHRTMEVNGRSTVSYLVRTPRVPFFMLILIGLEAKNRLAFQGRRGITSVVRWNLRPVIFGVESTQSPGPSSGCHGNFQAQNDHLSPNPSQNESPPPTTLKTITSLNNEARILKFSFFLSDNSISGQ